MPEPKYVKYDELPRALRAKHVMEIFGVSQNTDYAMIRKADRQRARRSQIHYPKGLSDRVSKN